MGHKHSRDDILRAALDTAFEDGLSQLTFGRVAKRLGINDRMVVYYFPTKDDLVGDVLLALGLELQQTLEPAFAARQPNHLEMARTAWPLLATASVDPVFALFFEANGLATAGLEPYRTIIPQLVEGWVAWAAGFIDDRPARRRSEAAAAIALLDGLLLLRQLGGVETAAQAARVLGVSGRMVR